MMTDVVLHTPEKIECRHKKQNIAAGPHHPAHLLQARDVVIKMLDDIESGYQIEGSILERQTFRGALPDF